MVQAQWPAKNEFAKSYINIFVAIWEDQNKNTKDGQSKIINNQFSEVSPRTYQLGTRGRLSIVIVHTVQYDIKLKMKIEWKTYKNVSVVLPPGV